MAKYDTSQGLGPMVAAVYRSWAFTQKDTIQVITQSLPANTR